MEIVNFPENQYSQIGAGGICPHCGRDSYFHPITSQHDAQYHRMISAARCQNCKGYGLVIGTPQPGRTAGPWALVNFYPLGKPDDKVDENVPKAIAGDFAEGLRCNWVMAYKACVVMCARAIQASAIALGAKKKQLTDQIDELFAAGIITKALTEFAHEIRATRNLGAHPDKDGLEDVEPADASDIIQFTREYMHHVYVMPALLAARKKPTGPTP